MNRLQRGLLSPLVDPDDPLTDDQRAGLVAMPDDLYDYEAAKREGWRLQECAGRGFVLLCHDQIAAGPFPTQAEAWMWAPAKYLRNREDGS